MVICGRAESETFVTKKSPNKFWKWKKKVRKSEVSIKFVKENNLDPIKRYETMNEQKQCKNTVRNVKRKYRQRTIKLKYGKEL